MPRIPEARRRADEIFGAAIAAERERRGWSRGDLAKMLRLTEDQVGKLERGKRGFSALLIIKLRQAFGMPLDKLLFGNVPPPQIMPIVSFEELEKQE